MLSKVAWICPPRRSVRAGAAPRYGTWVSVTWAIWLNISPARWPLEPWAAVPYRSWPGRAFARSISSHRRRLRGGSRDERAAAGGDKRHPDQIAPRVVGELNVDDGIGRARSPGHEERVAVRCRARHVFLRRRRGRGGAVLHDDDLAEALAHTGRQRAHDDVERAARGGGHDNAHRPRRERINARRERLRSNTEQHRHKNKLAADGWRLAAMLHQAHRPSSPGPPA